MQTIPVPLTTALPVTALPATALPASPGATTSPSSDEAVIIWYRAKRVWLSFALLLAAITFRLVATPGSTSAQQSEIQSIQVSDGTPYRG